MRPELARAALLAALLLTLLNATKPLVIDDPVYVTFAQEARANPGDPYGFQFDWYTGPEPAMRFGTIPPVLPYWLAGAMTLFGDSPVAWKLSLFPFALALTGALAFLLEPFLPPLAPFVLFALSLGPTLLPGFNLMLDVPAYALGLLGFALFVHAYQRRSPGFALLAGLALGLALQTKYSAAVFPLLVLVHAVVWRRLREGALALGLAAVLFVGWEAFLVAHYGQSHFLAGIERVRTLDLLPEIRVAEAQSPGSAAIYWVVSLFSLFGATALFPALLSLVALGARPPLVAAAGITAALGFAAVALLPEPPLFEAKTFTAILFAQLPELLVFVPLGLAAAGLVGAVALRLVRRKDLPPPRADRLLTAWLVLEVVGFFVISPFPATRRVIGLGVVATLLAARGVALHPHPTMWRGVAIATGFALTLAALYFGTDLADARARRDLIERVAARLPQLGAGEHPIWFSGHWELQFYGPRAGWRMLQPSYSRLQAGEFLVLPERGDAPTLEMDVLQVRHDDRLVAQSVSPWTTIPCYYSGPVPIQRQPAVQAGANLWRAKGELVPRVPRSR
jgi:4-amino-4-deoxy-L-arabinose transferase-like glycosyltransferase